MGQQPPEDEKPQPSLELPSLRLPGLGRRKAAGKRRAAEPAAAPEPAPEAAPETTPLPAPPPIADHIPENIPEPTPPVVSDSRPEEAEPRRRPARVRKPTTGPRVPGYLAAAITGLLVGGAAAGLTYAGLAGCERLTGTSSCGGGPGLLVLVAILVVAGLLGAVLLRALRVPEATGTSFLAVGMVAVVAMFLGDALFSQAMFGAVPALGAASYALAHWLTTRRVEATEAGPEHDVR